MPKATKAQLDSADRLDALLSNERLLHQAIAGLLARMPNVEDVQILHGASEFGKDVVFKWKGAFEESLPCACVIKKDPINGRVSSNQSSRTVFHQIEQAFDTPYVTGSGESILVQRVYVISPHEITQLAMHSICGALKTRAGQIIFIAGHELLRLFQKYWPNFLADEASAIKKYLDSTSTQLNDNPELSRVGQLYDIQFISVNMEAVYIDLTFEIELSAFTFEAEINSFLPSLQEIRLEDYWLSDHAKLLRSRFEELDIVLEYLVGSQLALPDQTPVLAMRNAREEFLKLFPAAWREYAMDNYPHDKDKLPNLPRGARIGLGKQAQLEPLCREMHQQLKLFLTPMEKALEQFPNDLEFLSRQQFTDEALLASPVFKRAIHLQNVARFLPFDRVSRRSRLLLTLKADLLEHCSETLLVTGPAGSGKTSFCRWNALRDIRLFKEQRSQIVPLYIALNCTNLAEVESLWDLIASGAKGSAFFDESALRAFKREGRKLRLYLDGLDEVSDESLRRRVAKCVVNGIRENVKIQVILTSRDYVGGSWLNWATRISLSKISSEQFRLLALRWFSNDEAKTAKFIGELNRTPEIPEITTTPLMATLTILVYRQTGRLPETKNRLYEVFVDLLSGGWDVAKGIIRKSHFTRDSKLRVLSSLAYIAHRKALRNFPKPLVVAAVESEFGQLAANRTDLIFDEILRDGILSCEGPLFQFRHLSFQEYLAARHCVYRPRDVQIRYAINAFIKGDDWWREVVRFYISMIGGQADLTRWLNTLARGPGKNELMRFFREATPDVFSASEQ